MSTIQPDGRPRRSRVTKEGRRFFGGVYKAGQKCLEDVAKDKLPAGMDCMVEPIAVQRGQKAALKREAKIRAQCTDAHVAAVAYVADCGGVPTVDDLVTCIQNSHIAGVASIFTDLDGRPSSATRRRRSVARRR